MRTIAQEAIRNQYRRVQLHLNQDTERRAELRGELRRLDRSIEAATSNLLNLNAFIAKQGWDANEVLDK